MSTIHDLRTGTAKLQRCPKGKAPHTAISRAAFGGSTKKLLTIPDLIDDYNHNMNGVDLADQLRASYNTHRQGVRTWLPLFYWLIDTLKVNAFLLWRMHYPKALHKTFQLTLHQQLVAEGLKAHEEHKQQQQIEARRQKREASLALKFIQAPIRVLGMPHPQVTELSEGFPQYQKGYRTDYAFHCLIYNQRKKKILVGSCVVCKAKTLFHCTLCQTSLCSTPGKSCINNYPCAYITGLPPN